MAIQEEEHVGGGTSAEEPVHEVESFKETNVNVNEESFVEKVSDVEKLDDSTVSSNNTVGESQPVQIERTKQDPEFVQENEELSKEAPDNNEVDESSLTVHEADEKVDGEQAVGGDQRPGDMNSLPENVIEPVSGGQVDGVEEEIKGDETVESSKVEPETPAVEQPGEESQGEESAVTDAQVDDPKDDQLVRETKESEGGGLVSEQTQGESEVEKSEESLEDVNFQPAVAVTESFEAKDVVASSPNVDEELELSETGVPEEKPAEHEGVASELEGEGKFNSQAEVSEEGLITSVPLITTEGGEHKETRADPVAETVKLPENTVGSSQGDEEVLVKDAQERSLPVESRVEEEELPPSSASEPVSEQVDAAPAEALPDAEVNETIVEEITAGKDEEEASESSKVREAEESTEPRSLPVPVTVDRVEFGTEVGDDPVSQRDGEKLPEEQDEPLVVDETPDHSEEQINVDVTDAHEELDEAQAGKDQAEGKGETGEAEENEAPGAARDEESVHADVEVVELVDHSPAEADNNAEEVSVEEEEAELSQAEEVSKESEAEESVELPRSLLAPVTVDQVDLQEEVGNIKAGEIEDVREEQPVQELSEGRDETPAAAEPKNSVEETEETAQEQSEEQEAKVEEALEVAADQSEPCEVPGGEQNVHADVENVDSPGKHETAEVDNIVEEVATEVSQAEEASCTPKESEAAESTTVDAVNELQEEARDVKVREEQPDAQEDREEVLEKHLELPIGQGNGESVEETTAESEEQSEEKEAKIEEVSEGGVEEETLVVDSTVTEPGECKPLDETTSTAVDEPVADETVEKVADSTPEVVTGEEVVDSIPAEETTLPGDEETPAEVPGAVPPEEVTISVPVEETPAEVAEEEPIGEKTSPVELKVDEAETSPETTPEASDEPVVDSGAQVEGGGVLGEVTDGEQVEQGTTLVEAGDEERDAPVEEPVPEVNEIKGDAPAEEGVHEGGDVSGETLDTSTAEEKSDTPVEEVSRDIPVEASVIDSTLTEPQEETPVVHSTLTEPPVEEETPVVDSTVTEPPVEEETPIVDSALTEPPVEEETPVVDSALTEPPVEEETPVVDSALTEPPVEKETPAEVTTLPGDEETPAEVPGAVPPEKSTISVPVEETPVEVAEEEPIGEETSQTSPVELKVDEASPEALVAETTPDEPVVDSGTQVDGEQVEQGTTLVEAGEEERDAPVEEPVPEVNEIKGDAPAEEGVHEGGDVSGETLDTSTAEEKSDTPVEEVSRDIPVEASVVDMTLTEPQEETPVVDSTLTEPPVEEETHSTVTEPAVEEETPVVDSVLTEPPVEEETPVVDSTLTAPPVEAETPVVDSALTEPPVEEETPVVHSTLTEPPEEQVEALTERVESLTEQAEALTEQVEELTGELQAETVAADQIGDPGTPRGTETDHADVEITETGEREAGIEGNFPLQEQQETLVVEEGETPAADAETSEALIEAPGSPDAHVEETVVEEAEKEEVNQVVDEKNIEAGSVSAGSIGEGNASPADEEVQEETGDHALEEAHEEPPKQQGESTAEEKGEAVCEEVEPVKESSVGTGEESKEEGIVSEFGDQHQHEEVPSSESAVPPEEDKIGVEENLVDEATVAMENADDTDPFKITGDKQTEDADLETVQLGGEVKEEFLVDETSGEQVLGQEGTPGPLEVLVGDVKETATGKEETPLEVDGNIEKAELKDLDEPAETEEANNLVQVTSRDIDEHKQASSNEHTDLEPSQKKEQVEEATVTPGFLKALEEVAGEPVQLSSIQDGEAKDEAPVDETPDEQVLGNEGTPLEVLVEDVKETTMEKGGTPMEAHQNVEVDGDEREAITSLAKQEIVKPGAEDGKSLTVEDTMTVHGAGEEATPDEVQLGGEVEEKIPVSDGQPGQPGEELAAENLSNGVKENADEKFNADEHADVKEAGSNASQVHVTVPENIQSSEVSPAVVETKGEVQSQSGLEPIQMQSREVPAAVIEPSSQGDLKDKKTTVESHEKDGTRDIEDKDEGDSSDEAKKGGGGNILTSTFKGIVAAAVSLTRGGAKPSKKKRLRLKKELEAMHAA